MKLLMLPNVLFDEFPEDDTVKFCIFTQPKYPKEDYSKFRGIVWFCCTEDTFCVLAGFKKIPTDLFVLLSERRTKFDCTPSFGIRCIPSGNVSQSVMLLIDIGDDVHLYTGQFTQCRQAILRPIVLHYKDKLNDIHVDNTLANFRKHSILFPACKQIKDIVSTYNGYKIYLLMELFGYEELLFELAREGVKIQLYEPQKVVFKRCNHGGLFEFEGPPQLRVFPNISQVKALRQRDYERLFDERKIIYIKLIAMEHEPRSEETIKGLFLVPYTPHATSYVLHSLFQTLKPKRVHPLVPCGLNDDHMTIIPEDILNDGCQIIDINANDSNANEIWNEGEEAADVDSATSFLDLSDEYSDDFSTEVDEMSIQEVVQLENLSDHGTSNDQPKSINAECVEELPEIEVVNVNSDPIEISDDDLEDNDLGLSMGADRQVDTALRSTPDENFQMNEQTDRSEPLQAEDNGIQKNVAKNNNRSKRTTDAASVNVSNQSQSTVTYGQIGSNKDARVHSKCSRFQIRKQIEYLSDSDDENHEDERSTPLRSGQEGGVQANEREQNDGKINEKIEYINVAASQTLSNQSQSSGDEKTNSPNSTNQNECRADGDNKFDESSYEENSHSESEYQLVFPD
ncbi:uncharacterized protein LOC129575411 [Sitodiplosis mosellana]|uniref:uncharacterized protein LOC129575411 n=1 Tax=Sitodiplosis mosellana TaxID=263140 RepID=UPI0024449B73|nr:uncharacterized protein LOC129575411 [Sitodiplosis mosellana]